MKSISERLLNVKDTLTLSYSQFEKEDVSYIGKWLATNNTCTSLTFDKGYSKIGPEGAKHIGEALLKNTTLTYLGLGYGRIGAEGARYIGETLKKKWYLKFLVQILNLTLFVLI